MPHAECMDLAKDVAELEEEVKVSKRLWLPIAIEARTVMKEYPKILDKIFNKLDDLSKAQAEDTSSLKSIHIRVSKNEEKVDTSILNIHDRINSSNDKINETRTIIKEVHTALLDHATNEEINRKKDKDLGLKITFVLIAYLVSFGVYMVNNYFSSKTAISEVTKDIQYMAKSIKELKDDREH